MDLVEGNGEESIQGEKKESFLLLSRLAYTSQEVFLEEYAKVYSRDWIYVGHISQLPTKGDYLICDYAGEEIVVVRGDGEQVFANLNVCRHRGYRLCTEKSGNVKAFVCGYHQLRFDLDGGLKNAPRMRDGEYFDYRDYGLQTARVEVWNGLIFVHLHAKELAPLTDRLSSFDAIAARFAPMDTKLAYEKKYPIAANWKIVVENAMECYHCGGTHESLCAVIDIPRLMSDLKDWLADKDGTGPSNLGAGGMRVKPGMMTMSRDGSLICEKLLGACTAEDAIDGVTGGIMVVPNFFYAAFYVDHWWTIAIRPRSAKETELIYSWFVRNDAIEGVDYDVQKLIEVADNTQTEDNALIERTQRGVDSRYFLPGPIGSDVEPALHDFVTTYKAVMAKA